MMKPTQNIMAVAMAVLACQAAWAAGIDATRAREVALQFLNANSGSQHPLRTAPICNWFARHRLKNGMPSMRCRARAMWWWRATTVFPR